MSNWKQSPEWEELFQTVIYRAKFCPAIALCNNDLITAEKVENAAGNHLFDDHYEFWGITKTEGHSIRAVFQYYSVRRDEGFRKYIQDLIDTATELKYKKEREKYRS